MLIPGSLGRKNMHVRDCGSRAGYNNPLVFMVLIRIPESICSLRLIATTWHDRYLDDECYYTDKKGL